MKIIVGIVGLIFVGVFGWFVGSRLSSDAVGMAVGIVFGILAGIPAALLVLLSHQQADQYSGTHANTPHTGRNARLSHKEQMPYAPQQPVIVLVGNSTPQALNHPAGGYNPNTYHPNAYNPVGAQQPETQYFDLGPADNGPADNSPTNNSPTNNNPATSDPTDNRQFRVVGEQEEWIQGWS